MLIEVTHGPGGKQGLIGYDDMHLESLWNIIQNTYIFILILWLIAIIILRKHRHYKIYLTVSAVVYAAALLYVTLLGRTASSESRMELSFLWEYRLALDGSLYWFSQIFDNVLLFVPMGWLYGGFRELQGRMKGTQGMLREPGSKLNKFTWIGVILFGGCTSFIIEFCQLVFKLGLFEFDDILNNTVGMIVGYGMYHAVRMMDER